MRSILGLFLGLSALLAAAAAPAQVRAIDPDRAIDGDLAGPPPADRPPAEPSSGPVVEAVDQTSPPDSPAGPAATTAAAPAVDPDTTLRAAETYKREDLIAAGEGVFGKGAAGLAGLLEKILREQGEPNAYIAGREAAGAFVLGLRYGSGVMTHRVEGERPVYWTGPSVGFDFGGDADKVFVLVYNLYDSQDLYRRFPAAEGRLYAVGGFAASYLRRGDVVLIPVRLGVGWRAGVNVGYMRFSEKHKWVPF